jgi:alpha/beta superfamily hydrolase
MRTVPSSSTLWVQTREPIASTTRSTFGSVIVSVVAPSRPNTRYATEVPGTGDRRSQIVPSLSTRASVIAGR